MLRAYDSLTTTWMFLFAESSIKALRRDESGVFQNATDAGGGAKRAGTAGALAIGETERARATERNFGELGNIELLSFDAIASPELQLLASSSTAIRACYSRIESIPVQSQCRCCKQYS